MTSVDIARAVVWFTNYSNRDDRCLYIFSLDTLQDYKCILAKTFNGRIHIGEWLSVRGATEYDGYLSINKNNYEILPFPCLPTTTSDRKVAISVHIILSSDGAHESSRGQVAWSPELQRVYMGARYEEMQKDKFYNLDVVRANRDAQNTYDVLWMTTEYSFPKEAQESYQKERLRESQELMRESARRYPPGFLNDGRGHYNTGRVWQVLDADEELNNGYRKPKPGRRRYKANAGLGPGPSDKTTFETFRPASLGEPLFSKEINRKMRNTLRHTFPGVIVRKPTAHEVGLVYSETLQFVVLERSYTESKDQRVNVTLGDWVMMCVRHNKKGRSCGGLQVTRLIRKALRHFITHVVDGNVQLEVALSLTDEFNVDRDRMLAKRMNLTESCVAFRLPFLGYVGVPVALFSKLRGKKIHAVIECRPTESKELEIGWQVVRVIRDDMEPDEVLKGVHNDNDSEMGEVESEHVGDSEENDGESLSDEETDSSEGDLDEYEGAEMERNPVRNTVQQRQNQNVVDNRRGTAIKPVSRYDMKGFTNSEQYDRAVNLVNGAANKAYQGSAPRGSVPTTAGKDEWHDIRPPTRAATQALPPRRSPPPPDDGYVFNDYKKERHNSETVPPRAATQTHRSVPEDEYVFNDYKKEHQGSAPSSETGPPRRVSPPVSANKSDDGYTYNDYTKKHQSVYPDTSRLAARLGSDQHQAALPSSSQQDARAREPQPRYTTPSADPRRVAVNKSDDGYNFDDYDKKYQSVYPDTSRLGSNRFDRPPPGNQNQVTQREAPSRSMSRNDGSGSTLSANSAPSRRPGGGFSTSSRNPSGSESRASAAQSQHTAAANEPLRRRSPPQTTSDAAPFTEYPRPGVPSLYSDLSSYPSLETTPSMLPRNRDVNVVRKELPLPPPAAPGDPVFDFEFDNEHAQDNAVGLICVRTASGPFFVIARVGKNAAITAVLPPLLAEDFDVGDWVVLSVAPLRKPLPGCDHVVIAPAIKHAEKQNITRPVGNYLTEVLSSTCAGRVKAYNSSTLMVSPDFGEILFPNKGVPSLAHNCGLIFPQQLRDEHVVWLVPQVVDGRFELVVTSVLGPSQDRAPKQLPDSFRSLSAEAISRILRDFDDYIRPAPQACCSAAEVLKSLWKLPEVKLAAKQGDYHVYSQVEDLLDPRNKKK